MKKAFIFLFVIIFFFGCSERIDFRNFVQEEDVTPVYFKMREEVPVHNLSLGIEYPLLFKNTIWGKMPIKFYIDTKTSENISWFSKNVVDETRIGYN